MRPARLAMATIYTVSFPSSLRAAIILRAPAEPLPRRHHAAVAAAAAGADAIEPALAGGRRCARAKSRVEPLCQIARRRGTQRNDRGPAVERTIATILTTRAIAPSI